MSIGEALAAEKTKAKDKELDEMKEKSTDGILKI